MLLQRQINASKLFFSLTCPTRVLFPKNFSTSQFAAILKLIFALQSVFQKFCQKNSFIRMWFTRGKWRPTNQQNEFILKFDFRSCRSGWLEQNVAIVACTIMCQPQIRAHTHTRTNCQFWRSMYYICASRNLLPHIGGSKWLPFQIPPLPHWIS